MKILFVIPAYNEEECILNTVNKIFNYNKKNKTRYDVLVINDGSTDKTGEILDKNKIPHIDLIQNLGIGGAVQTGYKYAYYNNYDIAIQYDGDGQHDVEHTRKLIEPIENKKANMAIGSRFIKNKKSSFQSTGMRRLGIKIISKLIYIKTRVKIYDVTSGFRAIDRDVMKELIDYYPVEYPEPISLVSILYNNYKIYEVPVEMIERKTGTSSISKLKSVYYMINVIISIILMKGKK